MTQQSLTAETIEGTVDTIIYQGNDGWTVAALEDGTSIVGTMPGVRVGADVEVTGEWKTHDKYGRQLDVDSFHAKQPTDVDGLAAWLERVDGVGATYARRLADAAGGGDVEPDDFRDVDGVPERVQQAAAEAWETDKTRRDALVALQSLGLTSKQADKAYERWGGNAAGKVESDPYCLTLLPQIGFQTADAIARQPPLQVDKDAPVRLKAGCAYALKKARQDNGHVGLPADTLCTHAAELLGVSAPQVRNPIDWMIDDGRLAEHRGLVYRNGDLGDEQSVASEIRQIDRCGLAVAPDAEPPDTLTDQQKQAFTAALHDGGVVTLTGGPGTGKTYTLDAIVDAVLQTDDDLYLAAPTGRAAKRITEVTGEHAQTVHRLLDFAPVETVGEDGEIKPAGFRCDHNSLDGLVVVDEVSMLDTALAARLFERIAPTATVLLVGDPDQLPSVGPGYVLHDILESDVGTSCHLTEIHRQAQGSGIVETAYKVNAGDMPDLGRQFDDFNTMEVHGAEQAQKAADACISRLTDDDLGYTLHEDIQVLAPMYDGESGVDALNRLLQYRAHGSQKPDGRTCGGTLFAAGDRVMQTRNNYNLGTMNGDIGTVTEVAPEGEYLEPQMRADDTDVVLRVDYPSIPHPVGYTAYEAAGEVTLAYACTIHKAQGSEYPVVVVVLTTQHWIMCERTLLYTAITRASERGILIADPKALGRACEENSPVDRHRNLDSMLNGDDTDGTF